MIDHQDKLHYNTVLYDSLLPDLPLSSHFELNSFEISCHNFRIPHPAVLLNDRGDAIKAQ